MTLILSYDFIDDICKGSSELREIISRFQSEAKIVGIPTCDIRINRNKKYLVYKHIFV